ncbi:hypothetical protein TNCV_1045081 [Trichonephila clavipes]|nr:hypothetical protein TNCV_1045081 [Trichonephila clavipes]
MYEWIKKNEDDNVSCLKQSRIEGIEEGRKAREIEMAKAMLAEVAFSERSSSPRLIVDETFNDSVIMNNLINFEDGQEARRTGFFDSG